MTPSPAAPQHVSESVIVARGATLILANGMQVTIPPSALSIDAK
jgi:hypothetical protein